MSDQVQWKTIMFTPIKGKKISEHDIFRNMCVWGGGSSLSFLLGAVKTTVVSKRVTDLKCNINNYIGINTYLHYRISWSKEGERIRVATCSLVLKGQACLNRKYNYRIYCSVQQKYPLLIQHAILTKEIPIQHNYSLSKISLAFQWAKVIRWIKVILLLWFQDFLSEKQFLVNI